MPGSKRDPVDIVFAWTETLDDDLSRRIRDLFNASLELDDIIGFEHPLDDVACEYLDGLRSDVNGGRKRLLVGHGEDGALVCMAVLSRSALPNCRHIAEVSKCIILPSRRGTGILGAGLKELLAHCAASGIDVLTLDVRKGTRAEVLWKTIGFRAFGELPDYARTGGQTHSGVYLWAPVHELIDRHRASVEAGTVTAAPVYDRSANSAARDGL